MEKNKEVDCNNCGAKFTLTYYKNDDFKNPEYCAFCGDFVDDVYKEIEEDDEFEAMAEW